MIVQRSNATWKYFQKGLKKQQSIQWVVVVVFELPSARRVSCVSCEWSKVVVESTAACSSQEQWSGLMPKSWEHSKKNMSNPFMVELEISINAN